MGTEKGIETAIIYYILACIDGKFLGIEVKKSKSEIESWFRYPFKKNGDLRKHNERIEAQEHQREVIRGSKGTPHLYVQVWRS